ncbi:MAG: hypothetical protein WBE86_00215 [Candidatus Acidiferrales bacterium]
MRRSMVGVVMVLAVGAAGYGAGRARSEARVVHADEVSKWTKVRVPLEISHDEKLGYVSVQGFWELTDASRDTRPLAPVAVKIACTEYNNTCGVFQASVSEEGVLQPDFFNYYVATWTKEGIVATDFDEGPCGLGHHLWLDLKNDKVTNTDYVKGESKGQNCPAATLHAYALRGGQIVLRPPAQW